MNVMDIQIGLCVGLESQALGTFVFMRPLKNYILQMDTFISFHLLEKEMKTFFQAPQSPVGRYAPVPGG